MKWCFLKLWNLAPHVDRVSDHVQPLIGKGDTSPSGPNPPEPPTRVLLTNQPRKCCIVRNELSHTHGMKSACFIVVVAVVYYKALELSCLSSFSKPQLWNGSIVPDTGEVCDLTEFKDIRELNSPWRVGLAKIEMLRLNGMASEYATFVPGLKNLEFSTIITEKKYGSRVSHNWNCWWKLGQGCRADEKEGRENPGRTERENQPWAPALLQSFSKCSG